MGRKQTPETRKKISDKIKEMHRQGLLHGNKFDPAIYQRVREEAEQRLMQTDFENLSFERKRIRIKKEQKNCCARCGRDTWFDQPIILELDHKNGISDDDRRENLEMLCPNCHSLTPTWRGRNKPTINSRKDKVSDDELIAALNNTSSIRQALLTVGMAAKGNNYERAKRLLNQLRSISQPSSDDIQSFVGVV